MAKHSRLEYGLALNKLAMMMDDENLKKCENTIKELENMLMETFDEIDELEKKKC